MKKCINETAAGKFFLWVTNYPKILLSIGILFIFLMASFLPKLSKDTSADAFMPEDHPAIVYRDKVKEIFGLKDPVVIAIVNQSPNGVFNPHTLSLIDWLTEQVTDIAHVDPDRITSLATENNITGTEDGMLVEAFFETVPETQELADRVRENVMDFPLYVGSLVSEDASTTLIIIELLDENFGDEVYDDLIALADSAAVINEEIYIAGEGAVSGYLGTYIDTDATRLNPLAAIIISIILFIAYRTVRSVVLPNFVVLGTAAGGLGMMAATGIPFFVITNALPVILIGIAVADSIHILGQYYEELEASPNLSQREIVVRAMVNIWRPVTLTTFTTIAGFIGIYWASVMPPMQYLGLFAATGVSIAWIYSIVMIPAGLSLLKPEASPAFRMHNRNQLNHKPDRISRAMTGLGNIVMQRTGTVLILASVIAIAGLVGAFNLQVNEERIKNFKSSEPIVIADGIINASMDGTNYLDIVVETPNAEDLFKPENLKRIEALQRYVETLPHVKGTTSIVDYLKQMNRGVNEDRLDEYRIPDNADLIAQYFLLYSTSGDPTDFEEEIDYDYRLANVRATLDTSLFTSIKPVVEKTAQYIEETFNAPGITANLSGRVNVDYHWINTLADSHFRSVGIALLLVWLMASISFRSFVGGTFAVIPVIFSVLLIYAVMGFFGIWLAIGTSMFAAISIGLGVDFAIHTVERLVTLIREQGESLEAAVEKLFPTTGRALFFNYMALFFGFGVLVTSQVPPLIRFGSLVAVSVSVSFLASMMIIPALVKVIRPKFLFVESKTADRSWGLLPE